MVLQSLERLKLTNQEHFKCTNSTVTVSGWGDLVGGGTGPTRLYEVDLPGMSNSACSQLSELGLPITDQMLCAGRFGENAVGACHGDSGGNSTKYE